MSNTYKRVKVTLNLPFAVDLPNDLYKVKTDKFFCGVFIRIKKVEDNPSGWHGNPRIPDDRFGHTNYSEVLVEFVLSNPKPRILGEENVYEQFSLEAINRLLDTMRWISDEYVNHHLVRKDIPAMNCKFYDENENEIAGSSFSMKGKIRFGSNTALSTEQLAILKKRLTNNEKIPFDIELIRNAKDHLKFENYRMASIEIQNAVEYVLSEIMTKYLKREEKTDNEIEQILKDFKEFKPTLKKATNESITGLTEYSEWDQKCAKLRHLVLHRGKQPEPKETEEAINAGLNFLKILERYRK